MYHDNYSVIQTPVKYFHLNKKNMVNLRLAYKKDEVIKCQVCIYQCNL